MDPTVYAWYERLRVNPDDAEALAYLWDYYAGRSEFQALAMLAEQIAGRRQDPASAADLSYRAGEIWAKNVGRPDKAVACYKRAFEGDSGQTAALEAAYQIYLQIGNHRAAIGLVSAIETPHAPSDALHHMRQRAAAPAAAPAIHQRLPVAWLVVKAFAEVAGKIGRAHV